MPTQDVVNINVDTRAPKQNKKSPPVPVEKQKHSKKSKAVNKSVKRFNAFLRNRKYALTRNISFSDQQLEKGVHEATSSFFFPGNGIFRGQAKAFEMSGLATLKGTIIANNATTANINFAFAFAPAYCNQSGWLTYGFGTTIANAINTATAALVSTTQAEAFRVVAAELIITPQGSFTNQAGTGATGYIADQTNFIANAANIANLRIKRPFKAVDTQIIHWLPSENSQVDETEFLSAAATNSPGSGFFGYITIPSASDTATSWQLDYAIGIEYLPSIAYRPWVDLTPPCQDIRANQFVNEIAMANWDPLMIGTIANYERELLKHDSLDGGRRSSYDVTHLHALQRVEGYANSNNAYMAQQPEQSGLFEKFSNVYDTVNDYIPGTKFDLPTRGNPGILNYLVGDHAGTIAGAGSMLGY
jgi:hypothetical protein